MKDKETKRAVVKATNRKAAIRPAGKGRDRQSGGDLEPASTFLPGIMAGVSLAPPAKPETPQARHHYRVRKQIDELLAIPKDTPDIGFMNRLLTLCSLPRTDPGERLQYVRETGPYKLVMIAGGENKLPFGVLPRLLLAWLCTEAVRTSRRELDLGPSLARFMRDLGMMADSGGKTGNRTRLREQIDRLFACNVELIYNAPGYKRRTASLISEDSEMWWDYKQPNQDTLWHSRVVLGQKLFDEIINNHLPLDMRILKTLGRSPLGLDLYMWLSYKTYSLLTGKGPKMQRLSWHQLYEQFGSDPGRMTDDAVKAFRRDALRELRKLKLCWPTLDYVTPKGFLEIRACLPSIAPKEIAPERAGRPVGRSDGFLR